MAFRIGYVEDEKHSFESLNAIVGLVFRGLDVDIRWIGSKHTLSRFQKFIPFDLLILDDRFIGWPDHQQEALKAFPGVPYIKVTGDPIAPKGVYQKDTDGRILMLQYILNMIEDKRARENHGTHK